MKPILYLCPHHDFHFEPGDNSCQMIEAAAPQYEIVVGDRQNIDAGIAPRVEILFGSPGKSALRSLTGLRWLQLPSAGCDAYLDKTQYAVDKVVITTANGVYGTPISEHILACFFAMMRFLPQYRDDMGTQKWERRFPYCDFDGSTVGIIGLGDIGSTLARKCSALGARVIAVKNRVSPKPDFVQRLLYGPKGIDEVVRESDFLALCLPSTERTVHVLNRERIFSMKKTAYVVNIGRGNAIDQDALTQALREKTIAGAALDVTVPEPLPADHELWRMDNCLITPHNSGRSYGNLSREITLFIENLKAFQEGKPMRNVVDFERGY